MAHEPCIKPEEKYLPAKRNVTKDIKKTAEQILKEMSRAAQLRGVAYPEKQCSKIYQKRLK